MPPRVLFAISVAFFIIPPVSSSLWVSVEESLSRSKNMEKPCMPPCKVFHSWCKNNGKCREKLPDCAWYCECPANCEGVFCERIITKTNNEEKVDVQVELIKEKETEKSAFDTLQLDAALANIYKKKTEKGVETPELKEKVESVTVNDTKTLCLSEMLKKHDRRKNQTTATFTTSTTEATIINLNTTTDANEMTQAYTSTDKTLQVHQNVSVDQNSQITNTEMDATVLTQQNVSKDQTELKHTNYFTNETVLLVTEPVTITTTASYQNKSTISSLTSESESANIVPIVRSTESTVELTTKQQWPSTSADYTTLEHSTILEVRETDKNVVVTESPFDSTSVQETTIVLHLPTKQHDSSTSSDTTTQSTTSKTIENVEPGSEYETATSMSYTTTAVPGTYVTQQESFTTNEPFLGTEMGTKAVTNIVITSSEEFQINNSTQSIVSTTDATNTLTTIQVDSKPMVEASKFGKSDSVKIEISEATQMYDRTTTDYENYKNRTSSFNSPTSPASSQLSSIETVTTPDRKMTDTTEQHIKEHANDSAHSSRTSGKAVDSLKNIIDSLIIKTANENKRKQLIQSKHADIDKIFNSGINDTDFAAVVKSNTQKTTDQTTANATTEVYTELSTEQQYTTTDDIYMDTQTTPESSTISSTKHISSTTNSSLGDTDHVATTEHLNDATTINFTTKENPDKNATGMISIDNSNDVSQLTFSSDKITETTLNRSALSEKDSVVHSINTLSNKSAKVENNSNTTAENNSDVSAKQAEEQINGNISKFSESQNNDSSGNNVFEDYNFSSTAEQTETTSRTITETTSVLPQTTLELSTPSAILKPTSTESINDTNGQAEQNKHLAQQNNGTKKGDDAGKHDAVFYPDLTPLLNVLRKFRKSADNPENIPTIMVSNENPNGEIKEFSTEVGVKKSTITNKNKTKIKKENGPMPETVSDIGLENYDVKHSEKQASFKDLGVIEESLKEGLADMVKSVNLIDGENIVNPSEESKSEAGPDTLADKSSKDQLNLS